MVGEILVRPEVCTGVSRVSLVAQSLLCQLEFHLKQSFALFVYIGLIHKAIKRRKQSNNRATMTVLPTRLPLQQDLLISQEQWRDLHFFLHSIIVWRQQFAEQLQHNLRKVALCSRHRGAVNGLHDDLGAYQHPADGGLIKFARRHYRSFWRGGASSEVHLRWRYSSIFLFHSGHQ